MEHFLAFLKKIAAFLELLLLEGIAIFFMMQNNGYQSNRIYATLNEMVAACNETSAAIEDYFFLKSKNAALAEENTALLEEVTALREEIKMLHEQDDTLRGENGMMFDYISAKVLHSTTSNLQNYILIDKGQSDGVFPEMGVVDSKGVVGIVKTSSSHFATIIPIIHAQGRLSSRIKKCDYLGSLTWDGKDCRTAQLNDVPRHIELTQGDSIVTSGLSAIFPKGLYIGTINKWNLGESDNNYEIEVNLGCDFKALDYVKVISYKRSQELKEVTKSIEQQ